MWRHKLRSCAKNIIVLSDIELAHHLAFGDKAGIVLNAGTGSIAFGRNNQGKHARAGGLGPLIGDEGSAFWMGREYLKMLYQQDADVSRIRKYVAGPDAVSKIAALAKIVLKNAEKNPQSPESQIVSAAQKHLKNLILEVLQKLRATNLPIHITGGLFQNKDFRHRWQMSQSLV
jgi:N-acetylglucosamine kinase-like BadF-type ATPase